MKPITVDPTELREAVEFVSAGDLYDNGAYVSLDTGRIHLVSDIVGEIEEHPDDLETSDRYIAVPDKKELDLGRRLVLSFIREELPDEYETVARFFRRKGAYGRLKELLASRGMLQKWHDYEDRETDAALRDWCEENGIQLAAQQSGVQRA
jgi:Uncharacterised protein family (UPF0158)